MLLHGLLAAVALESLKMVLTLGWPLVIKFALPPTAEVVARAVAEVEQAKVVVEVSNLSASR